MRSWATKGFRYFPERTTPAAAHAADAAFINGVLELEMPDEAVTVDGDGSHLTIVLNNLLNNAIKYSPEGGCVVCRLERDSSAAVE
jgi:signal transduction histidine kinase